MKHRKPDYEEIARLEAELFPALTVDQPEQRAEEVHSDGARVGGQKNPDWRPNRAVILRPALQQLGRMGISNVTASAVSVRPGQVWPVHDHNYVTVLRDVYGFDYS